MNPRTPEEQHRLSRALDLLVEGHLPAEEAKTIQERMKESPDLLALYLEKVRIDSVLRDHFKHLPGTSRQPRVPLWSGFLKHPVVWAAAAMLVISTVGLLFELRERSTPQMADSGRLPKAHFSAFSVFETVSPSLSEDGQLKFGDGVIMNDGSVSIRLPSGVEAILKSPTRFAITGPNRFKLDQGAGWFRVPPNAKGFTVDLPLMEVTDLGTVFTVKVDENEHQVQVEQGRVEVRQRSGDLPPNLLKAGEKLIRRSTSTETEIVAGNSLLDPSMSGEKTEVVFQESLAGVPDQSFRERKPLVGSWQVQEGEALVQNGKFVGHSPIYTHLMGRFSRPIEPDENAVILLTFKSVSPKSLFHSEGFAGVSLFDGEGELFFFGDQGRNSYTWSVLAYGKSYRRAKMGEDRKSYDLAIQGSQETFTLRYRQRNGRFDVYRGAGVHGLPILRGQTDPKLRIDGVRVANGHGGDFSFEDLQVSVIKNDEN